MCEALLGEFLAAGNEALFIGFLWWEDVDYVVFGVGFVALRQLAISPPWDKIGTGVNSPVSIYPP